MVISGCAILSAILLAHIASRVIVEPSSARDLTRWTPALTALLTVWLARVVAHWLHAGLSQRGASAVIADLSAQVLTAVTSRQPRQLHEQRGAAAAVVTRGLDGLRPYFTAYVPAVVLATILTPVSTVVLGLYDLKSAAIVLIALPLIPIFMVLIGVATTDRCAAALAAMATLQDRLLDLIAGIPTLRALGRATGPERRIAELSAAHRRSAMSTLRMAFLSSLVLEFLATLGVAMVAVSIGLRLVFGEISLSAGLTVLLLVPDVFWPLRKIGVEFHAAQDGRAAADAAFTLIGESAGPRVGSRTVSAAGATIVIDGLSVAGRDGLCPHDISAVVRPGQITVLTGANGAGKSATLEVMAGVAEPASGRVTVGGVPLADPQPSGWWRQIAWLPHRPVLVPGTVGENLALFGPLADVEFACAASGFDEVVAELPDGWNTVIGSGGVGLSLGQRQRLGLARALGSSAHVLLLDEPTAHLDVATESRVLRAVTERARRGATVVVVAHRERVIAVGDHVVTVSGASEMCHAID
jgi:ATP-binding cassette subfamily C protein CydD